jgi:alpha-galactosidase
VGSHVSAVPNHQTFRVTPIETRATVAMAGSFGYELDLTKLSEEEHEAVKKQILEYRRYDELVHEGDYYRLNSPYDNTRITAWQFMSKDKSAGLLSVVVTDLQANPAPIIVYPRGLVKDARYKIGTEIKLGASFLAGGYKLPPVSREYESFRFEIERL